jgi:hypothetical protein
MRVSWSMIPGEARYGIAGGPAHGASISLYVASMKADYEDDEDHIAWSCRLEEH